MLKLALLSSVVPAVVVATVAVATVVGIVVGAIVVVAKNQNVCLQMQQRWLSVV